ncbi:MAG: glycosyltransferase [Treponema sp.]|jgi:glycosyltransferase involved in cell wall biosynthesis|nr:glycosyltransferase [Treponema sp.]
MDKVLIQTGAFNAEDTLPATIESVLAQTYTNFHYVIGDNGSTDGTMDIIKKYAKKDSRISYVQTYKNFNGSFMKSLYSFWNSYHIITDSQSFGKTDDWCCFVDSDDTLSPYFVEKLLLYATENNLDMVACGWDFVRSTRVDHRNISESYVIERNKFSDELSEYDKFMGPVWNKLFRYSKIASNRDIRYYEDKFAYLFRDGTFFYGADTCFVYLFLSRLERFGLISDILYNYNIRDESETRRRFSPMRIIADRRLAEVRFDFLQEIGEKISQENYDFIMNIYFKSSKSTMDLLLKDDRYDLKKKMDYLHEMFSYKLMDEVFPLHFK